MEKGFGLLIFVDKVLHDIFVWIFTDLGPLHFSVTEDRCLIELTVISYVKERG